MSGCGGGCDWLVMVVGGGGCWQRAVWCTRGRHLVCVRCFVVVVAVCVRGLSFFVTVAGRCRVRCHVSPVSYVKNGEGEDGRVTYLYWLLV